MSSRSSRWWLLLTMLPALAASAADWRVTVAVSEDGAATLACDPLAVAREVVESAGNRYLGVLENPPAGSLGYGLPAAADGDFVLRISLTYYAPLGAYRLSLEAASIGSGQMWGIADGGIYPGDETLADGIRLCAPQLLAALPPAGRLTAAALTLEAPLEASRPAMIFGWITPGDPVLFPYLGGAKPLALVQLPAGETVIPSDSLDLELGTIPAEGWGVVVLDEALAQQLARLLRERAGK